jgi:ANTAR domain
MASEYDAIVPTGPLLDAKAERERAEHIAMAVVNSRRIGMAVGIVMVTEGLDEAAAFALLTRVSQHRNIKIADLALEVYRARCLSHRAVPRTAARHAKPPGC